MSAIDNWGDMHRHGDNTRVNPQAEQTLVSLLTFFFMMIFIVQIKLCIYNMICGLFGSHLMERERETQMTQMTQVVSSSSSALTVNEEIILERVLRTHRGHKIGVGYTLS